MRIKCPGCSNWFDISQEQIDRLTETSARRPWTGRFVPVHLICDRCEAIQQVRDDVDNRLEQMRDDLDKRLSG